MGFAVLPTLLSLTFFILVIWYLTLQFQQYYKCQRPLRQNIYLWIRRGFPTRCRKRNWRKEKARTCVSWRIMLKKMIRKDGVSVLDWIDLHCLVTETDVKFLCEQKEASDSIQGCYFFHFRMDISYLKRTLIHRASCISLSVHCCM